MEADHVDSVNGRYTRTHPELVRKEVGEQQRGRSSRIRESQIIENKLALAI